MKHEDKKMDTIIAYAKRKGFVFPSSEIYDGFAGAYDYGPHGVELANAIKRHWWRDVVNTKHNVYGLDAAIVMNPKVWVASGHVGGFSDPLADCRTCQNRIRVDKELGKLGVEADEKMSEEEINTLFDKHRAEITCSSCGSKDFTAARAINLLVKSNVGDFSNDNSNPVYLRGETCQGIYVNFKNVVDSLHPKIPFGIAQIGKAFRNEISPRQFLFRTREFEQMEMQFFTKPGDDDQAYQDWKQDRWDSWKSIGISENNMRWNQHDNLVFYAADAWDIEYKFPDYGFDEVEGLHMRTNYDLTQHSEHSGQDLSFNDNGDKFIPHVVETSIGVGRMFLAVLSEAYDEEQLEGDDSRVVLRFNPDIAPVQVAVLPLMKKDGLSEAAKEIFKDLAATFRTTYDESGSVGKRYRRQDEIGTPFCITYDYESKDDGMVTVRDRDSMEQERIAISDLTEYLQKQIK